MTNYCCILRLHLVRCVNTPSTFNSLNKSMLLNTQYEKYILTKIRKLSKTSPYNHHGTAYIRLDFSSDKIEALMMPFRKQLVYQEISKQQFSAT